MERSDQPRGLIGVTGATGHVGGAVAALLAGLAPEAPLRLIVRDAARAPRGEWEVAEASYGDSEACAEALSGVEILFMVSGAESADRLAQHRGFIDAAARAGVRHIVYTSFLNAAADSTFTLARDHAATEEHLRASGCAVTILRDSFYLDFFADLPGADGVIRGPAGAGRVGAVARADVARCAAAVLADPAPHAGRTYQLTGSQAFTLTQAAAAISEATGRDVRFEDETLGEAYASRAGYGAPAWQVDAWVSTYTAIAAGELETVTDDVRLLTGRDPVTLDVLLRSRG